MQICEKHWAMVRAAIEARGLSHLVAKSGEQLMANTIAESKGEDAPYDPLAAVNWMISGRALEQGGLYLMTGDYCPVCEVMKHTAHIPKAPGETEPAGEAWVERHWIDGPADAALAHCREQGLVPPPQ
jgi:hypothetical protein